MQIRRATAADAPAIADVHTTSWQAIYRGHFPDDYLDNIDVDRRTRNWQLAAGNQAGDLVVLEDAGTVHGFLHLHPSRDDDAVLSTLEVTSVYLSPEIWRQGYGRQLMEWAISRTRESNHACVTLWVLDTNQQARNFYESIGFQWDGTAKAAKLENGFEFTELRYVNNLGI